MDCSCQQSQNRIQYICLSPLCLQRYKLLCENCAFQLSHKEHQIIKIDSIFKQRHVIVENAIKYYSLNILKLKEQKLQTTTKLYSLIAHLTDFMNEIIASIDSQIDIQSQLVEEMIRVESIVNNHYNNQLQNPKYSLSLDVKKLLREQSICPQFEITNIMDYAEEDYKAYAQHTHKKLEFEEITACLQKNLSQKNFSTKRSEVFLENLRKVKNFTQYFNLQKEIVGDIQVRKPIALQYSKIDNKMMSSLPTFTEDIVPYVKDSKELPDFETLAPSKLFYDNNFKIIMNKYFNKGHSLVSMQYRQSDDKFFRNPPFLLSNFHAPNLLNLSVSINSTEFKNLLSFIQNHQKLQMLNIHLNADQANLSTLVLKQLFQSEMPNIQHFTIDVCRLNFINPIIVNELQGFTEPLDKFLVEKRNSLQTFQIDGLFEFSFNLNQMNSLLFNMKKGIYTHMKKLTFLVNDIDEKFEEEKQQFNVFHQIVLQQMPLIQQIKLYKQSEYPDVQRFFDLFNKQLKVKSLLIKIMMLLKSHLKFYRKEIVVTIIQEFLKSVSQMINTNTD